MDQGAAPTASRGGRREIVAALILGGLVLAVLHVWRGASYWNYSEGVYALSAKLFLSGADPYGHMVFAQPPGTLLFGSAALAFDGSIEWLRLVLGLLQLVTGVIAARAVWRMTGSRIATVATALIALLVPWSVHEHGALTPELFAAPLLLGAALLGDRARLAPAVGVLAALAPAFKLPYLIPAILVVAVASDRRAAARWALGTLLLAVAVFGAWFGTGVWRDAVVAQAHSGLNTLHVLAGYWGQEAWSLAGLVALAAVCIRWRERTREPRLVAVLAALVAAQAVLLISNAKAGTSTNIVVPVEACLVPLAVAGGTLAWRAGARWRAGAVLAALFVAAQTVSLLAAPRDTAPPFLYAGSQHGSFGRALSDGGVGRAVASARRCPDDRPYGGPPFIAFVSGRRVPDDQPDGFLTSHSATLAPVLARIRAVRDVCPP